MKVFLASTSLLLGLAGRADAQATVNRVTIGLGAATLLTVASDGESPPVVPAVTVRLDVRRHLALDIELMHWGSEVIFRSGPGTFTSVNNNVTTHPGRYDEVTTRSADSTWASAVNVLAHSNGRIGAYVGGGIGYGITASDYEVSYRGCSAPTQPALCDGYSLPRDNNSITFEFSIGADGWITDRIAAFTTFRASSGYLYRPPTIGFVTGGKVRVR